MAKKVSRKQLLKEPDQFLTFSGRMLEWAGQRRKAILWTTAAFFGLVIAISLFGFLSGRSEARAFTLLDQARRQYETVLSQKGPQEALAAATEDFQHILDDYAGRAGGRMARVVFADICLSGGQADRAVTLYTQALDDYAGQPFYRTRIQASLARALVEKEDYAAAVKWFEKIAENGGAMKDEALFMLGTLYAKLGEPAKSRDAFEKIAAEHGDSIYAELAREKARG